MNSPSQDSPTASQSPRSNDDRNQRILIIDDNRAIHEDVRKILGAPAQADADLDAEAAQLFGGDADALTEAEFEIDSAYQGQEGLEMVERAVAEGRPYAMAFVDVRMPPGWDGIETISRIWKKYPELQVVICTAYSDYSWADMIRQVGKTDSLVILKKPFDNVEVLQLAHTLTQKWTLSHRLNCHLAGLDEIVARRTAELQTANTRLRQEMEERAQAQRKLSESEQRFTRAFQASPIPMAILSLRTERYLDVNEAFVAISGRSRDEIVGRTAPELELCGDVERHRELLLELRAGLPVRNFECQLRARPEALRDCVVSAEAFPLGEEMVALVATLDFTDQRSLEKQLRHAQKLEAVGQFAAGVAHDFNNMLTVIQGHTSLQLAAAEMDTDLASSLTQVSSAADRAAALTRQLLMFSRKQIVQPRALNLNDLVRNLHDMLGRLIGEHIDLRCEFFEGLPSIHADLSNLEQVIVNLVVNARDAMPHGGRVIIRTDWVDIGRQQVARNPEAHPGHHICLSVDDTGTGMSTETLGRIFEPFFTTKEVGKGTGLGLATVYGIVTQQGGWIEVASAVGTGSIFKLYLPGCAAAAETPDDLEISHLRGGDETILVVEDEPAVRTIISHVLRHRGYEVLEASDGPEALDVWSEKGSRVDLLLTDIMMPNGIRGNMLAEKLRTERADLKVIFSTGYSSDFATQAAPTPDRINVLEKPYRPEVLVKAVRECLDA